MLKPEPEKISNAEIIDFYCRFCDKKMTAEPRMVPKKVMRRPMIVIAIGLIEKTSCNIITKWREYGFSEH